MKTCNDFDPEKALNDSLECIRLAGNRITSQRRVMVREILKFTTPFTAEELYVNLNSSLKIDLATIYRSLATFVELGILTTIDFSDGVQRYEFCLGRDHHHHHIVCTECKKIEVVDACIVASQNKLLEKMGYTHIQHKLEFFGICNDCG